MARVLVETLPSISVGAVTAIGALSTNLRGRLEVMGGEHHLEVVSVDGVSLQLSHSLTGTLTAQTIQIESVQLRFGRRPHFVCPLSELRCSRLYFTDGLFASRQGHGLAYRSQRQDREERLATRAVRIAKRLEGDGGAGRSRGRRRAALVEDLQTATRELTALGETPSELVALLDRETDRRIARRRRLRPRRDDSPMLTRSALHAGRTLGRLMKSREIREALDQFVPSEVSPSRARSGTPSPIRFHPELDIRRLKPERGFARGHQLIWPLDGEGEGLRVLARLVQIRPDTWCLELGIDDQVAGASHRQRLEVVMPTGRREMLLVCPINGTRHRKLYYRAGCFASAVGHRLQRVR